MIQNQKRLKIPSSQNLKWTKIKEEKLLNKKLKFKKIAFNWPRSVKFIKC